MSLKDLIHDVTEDIEENQFKLIDSLGSKGWHDEEGQLHRDNDKPAMISAAGVKYWFRHGLKHRDKGPAILFPTGEEFYWKNGKPIERPKS